MSCGEHGRHGFGGKPARAHIDAIIGGGAVAPQCNDEIGRGGCRIERDVLCAGAAVADRRRVAVIHEDEIRRVGGFGELNSHIRRCGRRIKPDHQTAAEQAIGHPIACVTDRQTRLWRSSEREPECLRRPEGALAREYLQGRGLNADTIARFRIGYAPDSGFLLRDRLAGQKVAIVCSGGNISPKQLVDLLQRPAASGN